MRLSMLWSSATSSSPERHSRDEAFCGIVLPIAGWCFMQRVFFNYHYFDSAPTNVDVSSQTVEIVLATAVARSRMHSRRMAQSAHAQTGGGVTMGDVLADLRENGLDRSFDGNFLVHEVTHTYQQRQGPSSAPLDPLAIAKGLRAAGYDACAILARDRKSGGYTAVDGGATRSASRYVFQNNQTNFKFL